MGQDHHAAIKQEVEQSLLEEAVSGTVTPTAKAQASCWQMLADAGRAEVKRLAGLICFCLSAQMVLSGDSAQH